MVADRDITLTIPTDESRADAAGQFGPVIASRQLSLAPEGQVTVEIGLPRQCRGMANDLADRAMGEGDWVCPIRIVGLSRSDVRFATGYDAVQALWLAFMSVGIELYMSDEARAGRLRIAAAADDGNLHFPMWQSLAGLVPNARTFVM
jgi:hypothetical protein